MSDITWKDFQTEITWDDLILEAEQTLSELESHWQRVGVDEFSLIVRGRIGFIMDYVKAKKDRPAKPEPETIQVILESIAKIRAAIRTPMGAA